MKKFFSSLLILCLITSVVLAQSKPLAKTQKTAPAKPAAPSAPSVNDELIGLLPASDLIAVVDVNRLFNELLPKLANIETGGVNKMAAEIAEFTLAVPHVLH